MSRKAQSPTMERAEIFKKRKKFNRLGLSVGAYLTPIEIIKISKRVDVFMRDDVVESAYQRKSDGQCLSRWIYFGITKDSEIRDIIPDMM